MWFILNPSKQVLTDSLDWSPNLADCHRFSTKDEALDHIRKEIQIDQESDPPIYPRFTGCRVVNLLAHIAFDLRKKGLRAEADQQKQCIYLDVDGDKLEEARRTFPRQAAGIEFKLRCAGKVRAWDWPVKR